MVAIVNNNSNFLHRKKNFNEAIKLATSGIRWPAGITLAAGKLPN